MAKKKCVKFGRSHGRKVCRKFGKKTSSSRSTKSRRGSSQKALGTPGVGKAIAVAARKRCGNPDRGRKLTAIGQYVLATARTEAEYGSAAKGKAPTARRIRGARKQLLAVARAGKKCAPKAQSSQKTSSSTALARR